MQSKSLLIAIAAVALTATGVHAHASGKLLSRANLSPDQRAAIEMAAELRAEGDYTAARDVLIEAGIDETALKSLRRAASEVRFAIHEAVEAGDYEAFMKAIEGTPLSDVITSEADFILFKEAHELRDDGSYVAARAMLKELGVTPGMPGGHGSHHYFHRLDSLTDEQREALIVAKQANDRETARAIWREAGIE